MPGKLEIEFRGVAFGANRFGVAMVTPMPTIEGCGLYVHVDDIQKYLDFEKKQEAEFTRRCHEAEASANMAVE